MISDRCFAGINDTKMAFKSGKMPNDTNFTWFSSLKARPARVSRNTCVCQLGYSFFVKTANAASQAPRLPNVFACLGWHALYPESKSVMGYDTFEGPQIWFIVSQITPLPFDSSNITEGFFNNSTINRKPPTASIRTLFSWCPFQHAIFSALHPTSWISLSSG